MPKRVTFEVSDEIVGLCGSLEVLARRAQRLVVLDALRERRISTGRAAELLEIDVWELHELAARHQIPLVEMGEDELEQELRTAERIFDRGTR